MDYAKIISAAARDMRPSGIRKFFDIAAEMKDCISLGVGEPDFKTPWTVRDAGIRSLEKGRTWYTSNSGLAGKRPAITFPAAWAFPTRPGKPSLPWAAPRPSICASARW